ncbi:uncharacterized protein LOC117319246 isoform X2 [Pecten maximus]|uniref:uncharacterized protein LOC117319246 isoform X2 n=1 Tax=Pecten maximus TaxID=6579 RepID=UPI00145852BE|nr:uncharacterized protein LOC117319246 isoform X2 [Pecten maximus]
MISPERKYDKRRKGLRLSVLLTSLIYHTVTASPPSVPEAVSVTSVGANILVQWRRPEKTYGPILQYQVVYNVLPSEHDITMTTNGQTFVLIPVAEHPGRLYRITVFAENAEGLSTSSRPRYLRVTYGCGGHRYITPDTSITVTSPFYPTRFEHNSLCTWDLSTNASYVFRVDMDDIDLSDEGCTSDYISLSDMYVEHEERLCKVSKSQLLSRGNRTRLSLHTGSGGSGRGFNVTIRSVVPVPGRPSDVKVVAMKTVIRVSWAPPTGYNVDHITAYRVRYSVLPSARTVVITLPTTKRKFVISTRGHEGQLYVVRVSTMHYFQEGPPSPPSYVRSACSTNIILNPGNDVNITSPGYPGDYLPLVLCKWRIISRSVLPFYFRMTAMDVEESLYCNSDYVSVSTWDNNRRCGLISTPEQFTRVSGELQITFVTDNQHESSGFMIEIKSDRVTSQQYQTMESTRTIKYPNINKSIPTSPSLNSTGITTETSLDNVNPTSPFQKYQSSSSISLTTVPPLKSENASKLYTSSAVTSLSSMNSTSVTDTLYRLSPTPTASPTSGVSLLRNTLSSVSSSILSTVSSTQFDFSSTRRPLVGFNSRFTEIVSTTAKTTDNLQMVPKLDTGKLYSSIEPNTSEMTTDVGVFRDFSSDKKIIISTHNPSSKTSSEPFLPLQPTNVAACSSTGNVSATNITHDISIQLILRRRQQSTEGNDDERSVEQHLLNKLIGVFNITNLFSSVTISKFGSVDLVAVPVSVVASYDLCGLEGYKLCEPSFSLTKIY